MGVLPTVVEYYMERIDKGVDLTLTPKVCCPFHHETKPSFSYSIETKTWRCFGACHTGGGVVELHYMKNRDRFGNKEEAKKHLEAMYDVRKPKILIKQNFESKVNKSKIEDEVVLQKAYMMANTVERWIELDYLMSIYPIPILDIEILVRGWSNE